MFWPRGTQLVKENSAAENILIEEHGLTTEGAFGIWVNEVC
jgi:hypothetical protein